MKTLLTKELYESYKKQNDVLLNQICQFEDETEIPKELRNQYIEVSDALIEYEKAYHPLPGYVSTLITDAIERKII